MLNLGVFEVLGLLLVAAAIMIPAARIARRLGYPRWLAVLAVVPLANVLLLWLVAFAPWPEGSAEFRKRIDR